MRTALICNSPVRNEKSQKPQPMPENVGWGFWSFTALTLAAQTRISSMPAQTLAACRPRTLLRTLFFHRYLMPHRHRISKSFDFTVSDNRNGRQYNYAMVDGFLYKNQTLSCTSPPKALLVIHAEILLKIIRGVVVVDLLTTTTALARRRVQNISPFCVVETFRFCKRRV